MEQNYDSTADTLIHIKEVNKNLLLFASELMLRAVNHDTSKLNSPEKELFDKYTPILKDLEYGTKEYEENLVHLQEALDHHYANNSHHPQHFVNGINGMTLMDIVEMFCDWCAAVKRTEGGDINKSIEINKNRFNMSDQLSDIFTNTVEFMV